VLCEDYRQSKFNIIHEGFYRFYRLFRLWYKEKITSTVTTQVDRL